MYCPHFTSIFIGAAGSLVNWDEIPEFVESGQEQNPASILPLCLKYLRPAAVGYIEKMCFQTDSHSLKGSSVFINLLRPTGSIKCNNCAYR